MTVRRTTGRTADFPKTLDAYARRLRTQMTKLERRLEKARDQASRRGTKLLREASEYLGRAEACGERTWREGRKEAARFLDRLEKTIEPKGTGVRKKKTTTRRKTATRKKPTTRKKTPTRRTSE